jgi:hypothetical protein
MHEKESKPLSIAAGHRERSGCMRNTNGIYWKRVGTRKKAKVNNT